MQYLVIAAAPDPTYNHEQECGGAHVGCWIKNQTRRNAWLLAKGWLEELGWVPLSLEEQQLVTADTYADNPDARRYFEQALVDDEVFVFHKFPKTESG